MVPGDPWPLNPHYTELEVVQPAVSWKWWQLRCLEDWRRERERLERDSGPSQGQWDGPEV